MALKKTAPAERKGEDQREKTTTSLEVRVQTRKFQYKIKKQKLCVCGLCKTELVEHGSFENRVPPLTLSPTNMRQSLDDRERFDS